MGVAHSGIHHQPVRLREVGGTTIMMKSGGWGEVVVQCNLIFMLVPLQKYSKVACLGKRKGVSLNSSILDENHYSASLGEWEGDCVRWSLLFACTFTRVPGMQSRHSVCATLVTFCHITSCVGLARTLCCSLLPPRIYLCHSLTPAGN